jgi:esterase/lipase superfamily enzyme
MSSRHRIVYLAAALAAGVCFLGGCGAAQAPEQAAKQTGHGTDGEASTSAEEPGPIGPLPAEQGEPEMPPTIEPPVRQVAPGQVPAELPPRLPSVDPTQAPLRPFVGTPMPEAPPEFGPDQVERSPPFFAPPPPGEHVIGKGPGILPPVQPTPTGVLPPDSINPLRPSPGTDSGPGQPDAAAPRITAIGPHLPMVRPDPIDPTEIVRGPGAMPDAHALNTPPRTAHSPRILMREAEPPDVETHGGEPFYLEASPPPDDLAAAPPPSGAFPDGPLQPFEPAARSPGEPRSLLEGDPLAPEEAALMPEPAELSTETTPPSEPASEPREAVPGLSAPSHTGPDATTPAPAEHPLPAQPSTTAASPPPSSPAVAREEEDYAVVQVFYGTDRAANDAAGEGLLFAGWLLWTACSAGVTLILLAFALRTSGGRTVRGLAVLGVAATVVLGLLTGYAALYDVIPGWKHEKPDLAYGMKRGRGVELGMCEVSIPKEHEVGVLEAPSIFKLELRETPERHVVLLDVERLPEEAFYTALSERVARSPAKDAFVFVHGYNVSFEDAARRTAQIAYDLDFPGAPVFYSWPSQASLTGYTVDENNVEWTVPHLREFLTEVVERSGAEQMHLVAHSMGNRALANALRGLSYRRDVKQPMFNHVVLTAPDVDADVFRRDLAPRIVKTAERVTLYASSNDKALSYSKTVHGYPRAGDTGEDLVVVRGIDTIDVSAVDTSLFGLGHVYYGSNQTVLADLFDLIRTAKPPEERRWLRAELLGSLRYWVFEQLEAARAAGSVPR